MFRNKEFVRNQEILEPFQRKRDMKEKEKREDENDVAFYKSQIGQSNNRQDFEKTNGDFSQKSLGNSPGISNTSDNLVTNISNTKNVARDDISENSAPIGKPNEKFSPMRRSGKGSKSCIKSNDSSNRGSSLKVGKRGTSFASNPLERIWKDSLARGNNIPTSQKDETFANLSSSSCQSTSNEPLRDRLERFNKEKIFIDTSVLKDLPFEYRVKTTYSKADFYRTIFEAISDEKSEERVNRCLPSKEIPCKKIFTGRKWIEVPMTEILCDNLLFQEDMISN